VFAELAALTGTGPGMRSLQPVTNKATAVHASSNRNLDVMR